MRTDLTLRLDPKDTPEVEIYDIDAKRVLTIALGDAGSDHEVSIWGTRSQMTALIAQFQSAHTKRLVDALRRALNLPADTPDLEVLLKGSLEERSAA